MPRKKANQYFETDDVKLGKEEAVKKVLQDFNDAERVRGDWEARKKKNFESYEGILPEKTYPWEGCSNIHVPLPRIVVDTFWANLSSSFPGTQNMIRALPISADDVQTAEKRTAFYNYQFANEVEIDKIKDKIFEISCKYGDCITKQRYVHIEKDKSDAEIENELAQLTMADVTIEPTKVIFDGVKVDVPNIEDIYKPGDSIGLQSDGCEFVIHRVRLSRAEYQNRVDTMGYPKLKFSEIQETNVETRLSGVNIDESKKNDIGISATLQDSTGCINILEWYGEYLNEKTNKIQELVIVIHPQTKELLKAFVNDLGFRPFVQHTPLPSANQPYGKGFPEALKYMSAELDTIHNQRRDSESKRIAQPGFYDRGSSFDPKKFTMEPNAMYPTDGPPQNSLYFPPFQGAASDSYREEEYVWRYVEQMFAIGKPVQGVVSPGDKTATEIASVVRRADIRFDLIFRRFENSFKEMVQQIHALNIKYMPEEKEFRILGSDGRFTYTSIKRAELGDRLDLIFAGRSVTNEMLEQQKAMQQYQIGIQNPLIAGNPANLYNLTKRTYEKLGALDLDKFLIAPPQALVKNPTEEHELMYKGVQTPVQLAEDAEYHLVMHDNEINQLGFRQQVPQEIQQVFDRHIAETKNLAAAQRMAKQNQTMQGIGPSPIQANNTAAAPDVGQGGMRKMPEEPEA